MPIPRGGILSETRLPVNLQNERVLVPVFINGVSRAGARHGMLSPSSRGDAPGLDYSFNAIQAVRLPGITIAAGYGTVFDRRVWYLESVFPYGVWLRQFSPDE